MPQPLPSSSSDSSPRPSVVNRRGRALALVTLAVVLAHWGLLYGVPQMVAAFQGHDASMSTAMEQPFITRTVPADAKPPAPKAKQAPVHTARANNLQQKSPEAPADTAQEAIKTIANSEPNSPALAVPDVQMATASAEPTAPPAAARLPDAQALQHYAFPAPVRLKYDIKGEVKGFPYFANGELLWLQDGKTYDARLEISHFLLGSRVQTSTGQLGHQGLEPTRFGDKVRSEVAAHFERNKGVVVFSTNSPDAPLLPGAQDQLSVFVQLASMLGGNADHFQAGTQIPFQAIGPRSAESWVFVVGAMEMQTLPGGTINAIKLMRAPVSEHDARVEVWLAPELAYMPVRIRLTQGTGDFVEQQWSSTQKP